MSDLGFARGDKGLHRKDLRFDDPLFGVAHFTFLERTVSMVPGWLPWHLAWAITTGGAFIAAGLAVLIGVYARLAAVPGAPDGPVHALMVWGPIIMGRPSADDWAEVVSCGC